MPLPFLEGVAVLRNAVADEQGPLREAFARAVAAFETSILNGGCSDATLDLVDDLIARGPQSVALHGAEMLVELARRDANALVRLRKIAGSKSLNTRFAVLVTVDNRLPRHEVVAVLAAGLVDKSKKIRKFACHRAVDLDAKELLPALESIGVEAAYATSMVKDGYFVSASRGTVTVKIPTGTTTIFVEPEELQGARLEARVQAVRDEHCNG
jgi:hypothetical protein